MSYEIVRDGKPVNNYVIARYVVVDGERVVCQAEGYDGFYTAEFKGQIITGNKDHILQAVRMLDT